MMTSRNTFRTVAGLALLGAVMATTAGCVSHQDEPSEPGTVTLEARLGRAERVETPRTIELSGAVKAERAAAISTRVMAMVTAVRVQAGDTVSRGQLLVEIDPRAAEGQVAQARGALAQAQAALTLAERNHERFKALAARDAASELELDLARTQHEQARGAVVQAEGAVAAASSVAADSRVVAPFQGRVVRKMVDVGDLAAPGRPLLELESEGSRRLALAVPESVMAQAEIKPGATLQVLIDSRPDLGKFEASVIEVSPAADPSSHSFSIEVALPFDEVSSGASARAWVEVDRRTIVAVPDAAIMHHGGLTLVVVLGPEGRALSRVVTLGEETDDGRVEVLSGLAGGETVVLDLKNVPAADAVIEGVIDPEGDVS